MRKPQLDMLSPLTEEFQT